MTRRLSFGLLSCVALVAAARPAAAQARDGEGLGDTKKLDAPGDRPPPATDKPADKPADKGAPKTDKAPDAGERPAEEPKSPWEYGVFGWLRFAYDYTTKDDRYDFVGRNNGFVLDGARLGLEVRRRDAHLSARVSIEGAADPQVTPNTPIGTLNVRLRDAFLRWDPLPFVGVQAGQFKAPFQDEELRGNQDLMFASRAVGVDGVPSGRGFQTPGIQLDRQLGVMLSPERRVGGDFGASYYLMIMNGNGQNQLLDDNGKPGFVGRTEVGWLSFVRAGAALSYNQRRVGAPPNLYDEEDLGLTGDLDVRVKGLEVFAAVSRVRTVFPTVGTSERVQLAYHAQAAYRFELPWLWVAPGYRYAYFHPWQKGGSQGFDTYALRYHTAGVRVGHPTLPIQAWINYTFTVEEADRKLDNDRLEILGQVTF